MSRAAPCKVTLFEENGEFGENLSPVLTKIQMGYQEAPLDEFARNSPFLLLRVFLDNFFCI